MYCKKLTKQELLDAGFTDVKYIDNQWRIFRCWRKNNSKSKINTEISITLACGKHKYRPNKYYHKITFSVNRKVYNIPLSRLVYVWFKGDIPDGYVVDHINNDSFDNRPENLQLLTVGDNLKKRFEDNPEAWVNQWEAENNETMNSMYRRITSINWRKEAIKIRLQNDEMVELIKNTRATRKLARTKTKRAEFDELHYGLDKHGDYCELYLYKDGKYYIYSNNIMDSNKNISDNIKRADIIFEDKFRELNNITLRRAFGFVDKTLKRCIPKQFYYINDRFINKRLKASSIDASSQYPSGCLGLLPDMHTAIRVKGRVAPSEEYRFAFYASGHCAEYGVFDTHNWMASKYAFNLFRLDPNDEYRLRNIPDEEEETILMKASEYTMDSTWNYFYDIKNNCKKDTEEYKTAKLIMNKTIGCWHRKDKDKTRSMPYDNHGSYQLAHIVAIAIARGNQKILNMIDKIGEFFVIHVCVDGIIYLGDRKFGIDESKLGIFSQEFINADFEMAGINVYCAKSNDKCIKFKHGGFDLLDGKEINEDQNFDFSDLYKLSSKEHVGDILWEEN